VRRVNFRFIRQRQNFVVQALVKHSAHIFGRKADRTDQIRATDVADKQRVAREGVEGGKEQKATLRV
jgi:hypothetical protein